MRTVLEQKPKTQPVTAPRNHLTMDTSALIQLMGSFEQCNQYFSRIDFLRKERGVELCYPDQIVYEFTGLLPESLRLLQDSARSLADCGPSADGPRKLHQLVKSAVGNSPCNSTRNGYLPQRFARNHAFLVQLMPLADPQQAPPAKLVFTRIGKQFGDRAAAEIEMAAGYSGAYSGNYRISAHDAAKHASDHFDAGKLRLTFRAAHNLGWFSTDVLKAHLNKGRHMTLAEVQHYLDLDKNHPLMIAARTRRDADSPDAYVLMQDLLEHGIIEKEAMQAVGRVWKLTLGDMFHSGLLPKEQLLNVVGAIDFPLPQGKLLTQAEALEQGLLVPGWQKRVAAFYADMPPQAEGNHLMRLMNDFKDKGINPVELARMGVLAPDKIWPCFKDIFTGEGFFEHHVSINDAARIAMLDAGAMPPVFSAISALASAHTLAGEHRREFNDRCRDFLPYEKVCSQALLNEAITMEEFLRIGLKSDALYHEDNLYKTRDGRIAMEFNRLQPERSRITVAPDGFMSRVFGDAQGGEAIMLDHPLSGKQRNDFILGDIMEAARGSMYETGVQSGKKYHRLFDAMLWPAVMKDATRLREIARDVLGDARDIAADPHNETGGIRLRQMEMDFATRHFRVLVKRLRHKPYKTPFTSVHAINCADRWDLGEIAILDCIMTEHRQDAGPMPGWNIVNKDNQLQDSIVRRAVNKELVHKKPDYRAIIESCTAQLRAHPVETLLVNLSVKQYIEGFDKVLAVTEPALREHWSAHYSFLAEQPPRREKETMNRGAGMTRPGLVQRIRLSSVKSGDTEETAWERQIARRRAQGNMKRQKE